MQSIDVLEKYLTYEVVKIKEKTTVQDYSRKENIPLDNIICESQDLDVGDIIILKNIDKHLHIVLPLETLSSIAKKYNVSEEDIKSFNHIEKVFIGQHLYI